MYSTLCKQKVGYKFQPKESLLVADVWRITLQKTNMTMENQPFEDVSPIKHGDFPASHLSFQGFVLGS